MVNPFVSARKQPANKITFKHTEMIYIHFRCSMCTKDIEENIMSQNGKSENPQMKINTTSLFILFLNIFHVFYFYYFFVSIKNEFYFLSIQ